MDGLWECQQLDTMLTALLRADINEKIRRLLRLRLLPCSRVSAACSSWRASATSAANTGASPPSESTSARAASSPSWPRAPPAAAPARRSPC